MSTLAVTNIQSQSSGTLPSFQDSGGVERGRLCRAFVNFDGTTSPGTIRSSFNVSSVTKNGTGDYTVNFTNALVDANYSISGASKNAIAGRGALVNVHPVASPALTSSSARINVANLDGNLATYFDSDQVHVAIFR
jgi:hypothetical protein